VRRFQSKIFICSVDDDRGTDSDDRRATNA
jgi:hypothetical protein